MIDIYGRKDPRQIPIYTAKNAARYLNIPYATIRSWTVGYKYPITDGQRKFLPPIEVEAKNPLRLTFTNLIEIHILRAIRQKHKINLRSIRTALDYLKEKLNISHPLASQVFQTDGIDLFINYYGDLINVSKQGQMTLKDSLETHLNRIEPDDSGLAIKLYPFTRNDEKDNPRIVVIDPRIAFGRATIAETGIATDVIAERFYAGDSPEEIAKDYECEVEAITEAIRCETRPIAA